jgi:hypothetical protein
MRLGIALLTTGLGILLSWVTFVMGVPFWELAKAVLLLVAFIGGVVLAVVGAGIIVEEHANSKRKW